jgi:hypothetical protein
VLWSLAGSFPSLAALQPQDDANGLCYASTKAEGEPSSRSTSPTPDGNGQSSAAIDTAFAQLAHHALGATAGRVPSGCSSALHASTMHSNPVTGDPPTSLAVNVFAAVDTPSDIDPIQLMPLHHPSPVSASGVAGGGGGGSIVGSAPPAQGPSASAITIPPTSAATTATPSAPGSAGGSGAESPGATGSAIASAPTTAVSAPADAGGSGAGGADESGGAATTLTGDFNHNFVVDAADYTVWRDTLGQTGMNLAADANEDLKVDQLDYAMWQQHFGEKLLPGAFSITGPLHSLFTDDFTISWDASANASSYRLELSNFAGGESPFYSEDLTTTSKAFTDFGNATIYVSVTAMNEAGSIAAANQHYLVNIVTGTPHQVIFVTSKDFFVDDTNFVPPSVSFFGSAHAADYHVTDIANQSGWIQNWNRSDIFFRALLTLTDVDLRTRASIADNFINTNGDVIATSYQQLLSGQWSAPILDEHGNAVTGTNVPVWTGANPDATWSGFTAENWTDPFSSGATVGNAVGSGTTWVSNGTRAANLGPRLYGIGVVQNDALPPVLANPIADQTTAAGVSFTMNAAVAFSEPDRFDKLAFESHESTPTVSLLPSWLSFNSTTGQFTGTPTAGDAGTFAIAISANELYGGKSITDEFQLTVTA